MTSFKQFFIGDLEARKKIISFSLPLISELVLMSLISLVNLKMVSGLGAYAISAVGLTGQPVMIALSVFQSFNIGATALIARFTGANLHREVKDVVIQTVIISALMGIMTAIPCFIFAKELMIFLRAKEDTLAASATYMKYMSAGFVFQSIPTGVASILRGAGHTKAPMTYNIIGNIVNLVLCFLLIEGFWFFPRLELQGAAVAATSAKVVTCIISLYVLFRSPYPLNLSRKDKYHFNFPMIKRIMKISLSAAGEQLVSRIGFMLYSMIIADLGTFPLAAHQIVSNVSGMVSNVVSGLGMAASSFTGRFLGTEEPERAEKYSNEIFNIGTIFSVVMIVFTIALRVPLSALFASEPEVIRLSAQVFIAYALLTFPMSVQIILSGTLRGAGDTFWPFVTAAIGIMVVRVALAAVFVNFFHLGVAGAWYAAIVDQSIRAVFMFMRFKSGKWKLAKV